MVPYQSPVSALWPLVGAISFMVGILILPTVAAMQDVGHGSDAIQTPVNQRLTPYGQQLQLPGMRPQALALAPNHQFLVISGKTNELVTVTLDEQGSPAVSGRVALPAEAQREPLGATGNELDPDRSAQVSYTGLIFSADGSQIYMSNVNGSIKVFRVGEHNTVSGSHSIPLPPADAPHRAAEIPSGLALSSDPRKLYVCGNLSNQLLEVDLRTRQVARRFAVGVAPYDVKVLGDKAYVSNWGGRRPREADRVGPAGRGTMVRVDPDRYIASEGSVSVVDLSTGETITEIVTGLHASALAVSPDERWVIVANAASDSLSVIDTRTDQIVETISAKVAPNDLFGASPNALAFGRDSHELLVANGSYNAVAIVDFQADQRERSRIKGFVPVGWYPGAVAYDSQRDRLYVANIKGLPDKPRRYSEQVEGFNSHHYQGSLSAFAIPRDEEVLKELSRDVAANMLLPAIEESKRPPRADAPPRAIPQRIGEPSLIKHVVYVIKENRTYDQVLGGIEKGRGRRDLCVFGEQVTPNQHRIVEEFVLLDNTYCAGILSADGHQWSTTGISTDYMEKSFAGFPRSYPDGMLDEDVDALAYSPAGFLWDNAVRHKRSIRNYGEFMIPRVRWRDPNRPGSPGFADCYQTWRGESDAVVFASEPGIESIRAFSPTGYVGWEMSVPDQYRADFIIQELAEFEVKGEFPQLVIICLPNDHTSGTSAGCPTPAACLADNDLAFGRIVDALSHSSFWPQMAIFAIEDDPQAGWDHISGYRTTAYCVSPFAKRGAVVSTYYNTTSILRTIEQILGMPPMNIFDASAAPMFDCFVDSVSLEPFSHVANNIPLDQMNGSPQSIRDPILRADAIASSQMNFREVDRAPEDELNQILWRAMKGTDVPYPDWAVTFAENDGDRLNRRMSPEGGEQHSPRNDNKSIDD